MYFLFFTKYNFFFVFLYLFSIVCSSYKIQKMCILYFLYSFVFFTSLYFNKYCFVFFILYFLYKYFCIILFLFSGFLYVFCIFCCVFCFFFVFCVLCFCILFSYFCFYCFCLLYFLLFGCFLRNMLDFVVILLRFGGFVFGDDLFGDFGGIFLVLFGICVFIFVFYCFCFCCFGVGFCVFYDFVFIFIFCVYFCILGVLVDFVWGFSVIFYILCAYIVRFMFSAFLLYVFCGDLSVIFVYFLYSWIMHCGFLMCILLDFCIIVFLVFFCFFMIILFFLCFLKNVFLFLVFLLFTSICIFCNIL